MASDKYGHLFKPLKMAEIPGQAQIFKNTGNAAMTIPSGFTFTGDFEFGGTGTCKVGVSYDLENVLQFMSLPFEEQVPPLPLPEGRLEQRSPAGDAKERPVSTE